jgi:hypothetical protein
MKDHTPQREGRSHPADDKMREHMPSQPIFYRQFAKIATVLFPLAPALPLNIPHALYSDLFLETPSEIGTKV